MEYIVLFIVGLILYMGINCMVFDAYLEEQTEYKDPLATEGFDMLLIVFFCSIYLIFNKEWLANKRKLRYYEKEYNLYTSIDNITDKSFLTKDLVDYAATKLKNAERGIKLLKIKRKITKDGRRNI